MIHGLPHARALPSALIGEAEPLAPHTSWRVGGPARFYAAPRSAAELRLALVWAAERELPVFILGGGSNLLVRDTGFDGLVVRFRDTAWRIEERDDTALLHVGAGAPMAGTARRVSGLGWAGLAWAEGLPGTIGGAVFGNAGCYGGDIASSLEYATLLVGDEMEQWPAVRMGYGYRISTLKERGRHQAPATGQWQPIVVGAAIRLQRGDRQELAATMARIAAERRGKTPWGHSCGSVFKNPAGASAGGLIEQAGLKGTRRGSAEISERHGNYIVNHGGASSDDILGLIAVAQNEVLRQFGVQLELEVQIV